MSGPVHVCAVCTPLNGVIEFRLHIYIYVFLPLQEKDLKQYMDDCGSIMSVHNVKVKSQVIQRLIGCALIVMSAYATDLFFLSSADLLISAFERSGLLPQKEGPPQRP